MGGGVIKTRDGLFEEQLLFSEKRGEKKKERKKTFYLRPQGVSKPAVVVDCHDILRAKETYCDKNKNYRRLNRNKLFRCGEWHFFFAPAATER